MIECEYQPPLPRYCRRNRQPLQRATSTDRTRSTPLKNAPKIRNAATSHMRHGHCPLQIRCGKIAEVQRCHGCATSARTDCMWRKTKSGCCGSVAPYPQRSTTMQLLGYSDAPAFCGAVAANLAATHHARMLPPNSLQISG